MVEVANTDQMVSIYRRARNAGLDVMLQEFIPGGDANGVNYNSYFDAGEPLVEFTAEKVRNAPPRFGSPRVAISKVIPEVHEPGRRILKAMKFYGYSCTEFKRDERDGVYKLMEVNGRHNLSSLLAVRCGINFPWLHYRHLVYGERPVASEYQEGVYWVDLIRDVGYSLKCGRQEHYSLGDYLRPYAKPHVFAVLDFKDVRPFAKQCADLVGFRGN
jgi:predicted ATP-grasp superfamily ATP-dependent carboligase